MGDWHKAEISDVALEFGTDIKSGRMNIDSSRARKHNNNNVFRLPDTDAKTIVRNMASDASLILLAVTYLLSSLLGHAHESAVGIAFIVIIFIIGCSIKYRSDMRVTNSYRLLLPVAKVTENGQNYRLSVFDVEVGDLITFTRGDIIPADARLVTSSNLTVADRILDEATGKSMYKRSEKRHDALEEDSDTAAHYANTVYAGSMVVSGKGSAIVTAIGNETLIAKVHSGISFTPQRDKPSYLSRFNTSAKRFSLIALLSVVPVALLGLLAQTLNAANEADGDILYTFLLSLALASTCMSELVAAPAESIVTKEILPSSRVKKSERAPQSRITKLSASEALADTDTILILAPEILLDKKQFVRRVFFADKKYRFDALFSNEVRDLAKQVYPYFACISPRSITSDGKIIKSYLDSFDLNDKSVSAVSAKILRNYPIDGARASVLEFDANGAPCRYIACSDDIAILKKCASFRTEGGGIWKLDNEAVNRITDYFQECVRDGLSVYLYISRENASERPIFEGILAVGEEFPYADGYLSEDFSDSGIMPILVFESENQTNINFALKCGLVKDRNEIALASEYYRAGLKITDASISTKVYIGFGKGGTEQLTKRLCANGKNVLPVIKDSANRQAVSPLSVYATHQLNSFDSVKIASSLILKPAVSRTRSGGLADALKTVRESAIARLKLGVYKNYLLYSSFVRITAVAIPMLIGKASYLMTALMVLLTGFICDYLALLVIMHTKRIAVRPKSILSESKRLFSPSLALFSVAAAFLSALTAVVICGILVSTNKLSVTAAPTFIMISCIAVQYLALGGFITVLSKHTRPGGINFLYYLILIAGVGLLFLQSAIPQAFFAPFAKAGFSQISMAVFPYIAVSAIVAFVSVALIGKIASFDTAK